MPKPPLKLSATASRKDKSEMNGNEMLRVYYIAYKEPTLHAMHIKQFIDLVNFTSYIDIVKLMYMKILWTYIRIVEVEKVVDVMTNFDVLLTLLY